VIAIKARVSRPETEDSKEMWCPPLSPRIGGELVQNDSFKSEIFENSSGGQFTERKIHLDEFT
jgi:hypothetical protein